LNAVLIRYLQTSAYTRSAFVIDGHTFYTIERPWLDNATNISCIPTGDYRCVFLPRSGSGKYKKVFHILDVPKRSGILIHNGNLVRHSKGCIIIGWRTGLLGGSPAVLYSMKALRLLREITNCGPFNLKIIGGL